MPKNIIFNAFNPRSDFIRYKLVVQYDNRLCNRRGQFVSKFEIEKYKVCGKLILPQKMERNF